MNTILRISEVLHEKYGYYVPIQEIGMESILLDKSEIDEELIAPTLIDHLEGLIQTESANYTDTEGNYYVVIQIEIGHLEPYEIWMVNDELKKDFLDHLK